MVKYVTNDGGGKHSQISTLSTLSDEAPTRFELIPTVPLLPLPSYWFQPDWVAWLTIHSWHNIAVAVQGRGRMLSLRFTDACSLNFLCVLYLWPPEACQGHRQQVYIWCDVGAAGLLFNELHLTGSRLHPRSSRWGWDLCLWLASSAFYTWMLLKPRSHHCCFVNRAFVLNINDSTRLPPVLK